MYEDDRRTASLESGTLRVAKHLARLDAMGLRKTSGLTYLSRARSPSNSSPRVSKIAEELQTLKKISTSKETTRILYRHHVSKSPNYILKRWLTEKKEYKPKNREKEVENITNNLLTLKEVVALREDKKKKKKKAPSISEMIYASRVIQRATRRRLSVEGWSYCRSGKSLIWVRNSDGYVARKRPKPIPRRKPKSAKLLWEFFRQSVRFVSHFPYVSP